MRVVAAAAVVFAAIAAAAAYSQSRIDPAGAFVDGCRGQAAIIRREAPNWAYVGEAQTSERDPPPPPQWAKGIARSQYEPWLAVHPTGVDNPATHTAYDLILNLELDPEYRFLLSGDPESRTGNFRSRTEIYGRLHTEWQEDAFPLWAWPEKGDRIEMKGSWVWDCDHIEGGAHTEFHPIRAIWAIRNPGGPSPRSPRGESEGILFVSSNRTPAGREADCNHVAKGNVAEFRACIQAPDPNIHDVSGSYRFFLPAPPKPSRNSRLHLRVVDRGTTRGISVSVRARGNGAEVTFAIPPTHGPVVVAKQVFAGWRPLPRRARPIHLRVTFDELLVRRAMDPGCPIGQPNCTTPETEQGNQGTTAPGEWALYWNVAGVWGRWSPTVLRARSGRRYRSRHRVDIYLPRRQPFRVFVYGRECDFGLFNAYGPGLPVRPCPVSQEIGHPTGDDVPGAVEARFRSPLAAIGTHRRNAMTLDDSTCPARANPRGCYRVTFTVRRIG